MLYNEILFRKVPIVIRRHFSKKFQKITVKNKYYRVVMSTGVFAQQTLASFFAKVS
jgi:hypothetical protein